MICLQASVPMVPTPTIHQLSKRDRDKVDSKHSVAVPFNNQQLDMTTEPTTPSSSGMTATSTTTRICIKNLPPSFNDSKVKHHLYSNVPSLVLTDCKMLKTKDGRSRKIAFVGFKTPEVRLVHIVLYPFLQLRTHKTIL